MKLNRFKCTVCKKEFFTYPDDVEEIRAKKDDPICPFCEPKPGQSISRAFEVGDIEFDDRSKLDGDDLDGTVEFLKTVADEVNRQFESAYHRIERLKRQPVDDEGEKSDESK